MDLTILLHIIPSGLIFLVSGQGSYKLSSVGRMTPCLGDAAPRTSPLSVISNRLLVVSVISWLEPLCSWHSHSVTLLRTPLNGRSIRTKSAHINLVHAPLNQPRAAEASPRDHLAKWAGKRQARRRRWIYVSNSIREGYYTNNSLTVPYKPAPLCWTPCQEFTSYT